jgi:hypothetical protein
MQQRDQPRAALVEEADFLLDPGTDVTRLSRKRGPCPRPSRPRLARAYCRAAITLDFCTTKSVYAAAGFPGWATLGRPSKRGAGVSSPCRSNAGLTPILHATQGRHMSRGFRGFIGLVLLGVGLIYGFGLGRYDWPPMKQFRAVRVVSTPTPFPPGSTRDRLSIESRRAFLLKLPNIHADIVMLARSTLDVLNRLPDTRARKPITASSSLV